MQQVLSEGSGYYSLPTLVSEGKSYCIAASFEAVWDAAFLTTSSDQLGAAIGSFIYIDDEYMKVLSVDSQNLFVLTVSRGELDTAPVEHEAGSRLYIKLEHVLGTGATCTWSDDVNVTYAPYPYALSTLTVSLGYNATPLTCKQSFDETGKKVCLQPTYGPTGSQVYSLLFLRPGTIYQRHVLSYPAGVHCIV
jgi:hypothetical protein